MLTKLAGKFPPIMDQYDDGGRLFLAELGGNEIPEIVKTAADMSGVTKYETDFALAAQAPTGAVYKYPILDPGNAVVSAVYFAKTAQYLPAAVRAQAAERIVAALQEYGLAAPAEVLEMTFAKEKTASVDDQLLAALPRDVPYDTELQEQFTFLSPMGKRQAALLVKQAGMRLPEDLQVYGGERVGSDFEAAIDMRKRYLPENMALAIDHMKKVAGCTPDELAQELYEIDVELGLTPLYGKIPDPFQSVFGTSLAKVAFHQQTSVTINDRGYSAERIAEFAASHSSQLGETFGDHVAKELAESPVAVLESLPMPHKQAIARMLDAA